MADLTLILPQFPSAPPLPGVPPLKRNPLAPAFVAQQALTGDDPSISAFGGSTTQWGVFDDQGNQVLEPDSIVVVEEMKEWRISDYPVEDGSFQSYNKVEMPQEVRVTMVKGGQVSDRQQFLSDLDSIAGDTKLYTVVTPEIEYDNVNLERHSLARSSRNGVSLIAVEIVMREIRVTANGTLSNTKQPDGADAVDGGSVQPQTPTAQQQAAAGTPS